MKNADDPVQQSAIRLRAKPSSAEPKARIATIKALIKRPLPPEYLRWLELCGKCHIKYLELEFFTESQPKDASLVELRAFLPDVVDLGIPITVDGNGCFFVLLDTHPKRPVVFVESTAAYEAQCIVASSLERFLFMLCEAVASRKEDWWTDKQFIQKHDPAVLKFRGIPKPWDE